MAHNVTCFYCNQRFDRDKLPFIAIPDKYRRYAHRECYEKAESASQQEEEDREKLEAYVRQLFGYKTLPERVNKQISSFRYDKDYSYSAIYKSLVYFFEIKKNTTEKANGGIGIVPYIIEDARAYWLAIMETQERNREFKVEECVLPEREVHILSPKRESMKRLRPLFTFLNEEASE